MSELTFPASDDAPSLFGTLTTPDGALLDLTDATAVRFRMRLDYDRRFSVDAPATIVAAESGSVRYDWAAGDLGFAGTYKSRWQIEWSNGSRQDTDPQDTIIVAPV